ncbi:hypothetical protein PV326_000944 [Microctonus aethiopoides]|nr:hypothetical protein PV326_000944 [Microctonus aethiopoides]
MLTARSSPLGVGRGPRTLGPAEGSDHLFLLPERALIMDSTQLRQDLAGLDFNLHLNLLHTAPRGNVWLCDLIDELNLRNVQSNDQSISYAERNLLSLISASKRVTGYRCHVPLVS